MTATRRVLYQLPGRMDQVLGAGVLKDRAAYLARHAAPDVAVQVRANPDGPEAIESARDAALAAPGIMRSIAAAEDEGFAGAINGCFSDPGMAAIRQSVRMPVVGPGASALRLAIELGERFSILSPRAGGAEGRARLRLMGIENRLASIRPVGLTVIDIARNRDLAVERAAQAGQRAVTEDGADVLVLGCMSLAFQDAAAKLQDRLGVPVINPVLAALKNLEMLLAMNLSHSAVAFLPIERSQPSNKREAV
ncbi:MAG: aspartate/glutamate racemase family protein [Alphaproteobacteria bacterium]|nr:aspartate/glutamate racemase family protein [Alphaproteobacteria bacterium]